MAHQLCEIGLPSETSLRSSFTVVSLLTSNQKKLIERACLLGESKADGIRPVVKGRGEFLSNGTFDHSASSLVIFTRVPAL